MEINDILIRPVITEKSMECAQRGVYTFIVAKKARKEEIKRAIEEQFNVNITSIKTMLVKGKTRLAGRKRLKIRTSDFKKALVKLKKDQKIELFEAGK